MKHLTHNRTIAVVIIAAALFLTGCDHHVSGSGNIVRKELSVAPFSAIEASGTYQIHLAHGARQEVIVEADSTIIDYLRIATKGRKLQLHLARVDFTDAHLKVFITFTDLDRIYLSGATELESYEPLTFNRLSIKCSGAASVGLQLNAQRLTIELSGAGNTDLKGTTDRLQADLSGASKMFASGLLVNQARVSTSGASHVAIHIAGRLDARATGASSIAYYGNPDVTSAVSGAATVTRIE